MGFVDIARRADRQIILLDPAEELAAVNLVAADGQTASILAGELGQELIQGFVKASRYRCHGHTVANPAISGQTRDPEKSGSDNR